MPQDAEAEAPARQLDRLDQVVVDRPAADIEALAELGDTLVMVRFDRDLHRTGGVRRERAGNEADVVVAERAWCVPVAIRACRPWDVLVEGPAAGDVQQLHPAADPEQGNLTLQRAVRE